MLDPGSVCIYNEHGSATWLVPGELLCVSLDVRGGDPALLGTGPRDLSDQGAAPEGCQKQVLHGKRYVIHVLKKLIFSSESKCNSRIKN
jgi:hypothetical protein